MWKAYIMFSFRPIYVFFFGFIELTDFLYLIGFQNRLPATCRALLLPSKILVWVVGHSPYNSLSTGPTTDAFDVIYVCKILTIWVTFDALRKISHFYGTGAKWGLHSEISQ